MTTANGSIDVEATDVNISGLTQVLTAPFDPTTTDVTVTATNGSVQLGQGIRAVNKVVIDQRTQAAIPTLVGSVSSNGLISANDLRVFSQGNVTIDTASPNVKCRLQDKSRMKWVKSEYTPSCYCRLSGARQLRIKFGRWYCECVCFGSGPPCGRFKQSDRI